MRVTFISHAATAALRRAAFPLDEPVERSELSKIKTLPWRAPRAEHLLCAPEVRATATAGALGLTTVVDNDLCDCDYGHWKGFDLTQVHKSNPNDVATWLTEPSANPHGG